jgi:hypothetical protein
MLLSQPKHILYSKRETKKRSGFKIFAKRVDKETTIFLSNVHKVVREMGFGIVTRLENQ